MISMRAIKPKKFEPYVFRQQQEQAFRDIGAKVARRYEKTVETWDADRPTFKVSMMYKSYLWLRVLLTGSEMGIKKWNWLNAGTRVRRALMSDDWQSKTAPNDYQSGPGQGRVVFISRDLELPGIKARRWSKMADKEFRPEFKAKVQAAYNEAAKRSGHRAKRR
jgi:hypothetical protein